MLVTVSFVTVPSPLELSIAILSWNSRSYLEMPTINQLNSLAGQSTKTMKTSPPALPLNIISANILPMVLLAKLLPFPRFYSPFPRFSFPHFPFLLLGQPPGNSLPSGTHTICKPPTVQKIPIIRKPLFRTPLLTL